MVFSVTLTVVHFRLIRGWIITRQYAHIGVCVCAMAGISGTLDTRQTIRVIDPNDAGGGGGSVCVVIQLRRNWNPLLEHYPGTQSSGTSTSMAASL